MSLRTRSSSLGKVGWFLRGRGSNSPFCEAPRPDGAAAGSCDRSRDGCAGSPATMAYGLWPGCLPVEGRGTRTAGW